MNKLFPPAAIALSALAVGACTSSSSDSSPSSVPRPAASSSSEVNLAGACPETVVFQTDWFPQAEHGALYKMLGADYTIDTEVKSVTGSLTHKGEPTGVNMEIRVGGPAIGWASPAAQMMLDDSITLAYDNTDSAILARDSAPTLAVIAPLEVNPQYIQWDPETYPAIESISDIGSAEILVNTFGGAMWADVLVAQGVLRESQIDPSYDGSPARFIAEQGAIAQQGFITAEPYNYENEFDAWMRPVAGQTLHDAGYEIYAATLAINPSRQAELDACLTGLVPVIQQAIVDYSSDFEEANDVIVAATDAYGDAWTQTRGLTDWSVQQQLSLGIIGNGGNSTVGDFDSDRQERLHRMFVSADLLPEELATYTDLSPLWTNEYIDPEIGF